MLFLAKIIYFLIFVTFVRCSYLLAALLIFFAWMLWILNQNPIFKEIFLTNPFDLWNF
jgi:hypothetical protein